MGNSKQGLVEATREFEAAVGLRPGQIRAVLEKHLIEAAVECGMDREWAGQYVKSEYRSVKALAAALHAELETGP